MCLIAFHIWSHKTLTLRSVSFPGSLLSKRNTCGVPKSAGDSKFKYSFEYGASYVDFLLILRQIGNVWNTRRGSVKVLKSWAHTRHTTRSGAQIRWDDAATTAKNVFIWFLISEFFVIYLFLSFCRAQIAYEIDWLSSFSHFFSFV